MKRIAIFADGTWNSPDEDNASNVMQMARAVKPRVGKTQQIAFSIGAWAPIARKSSAA